MTDTQATVPDCGAKQGRYCSTLQKIALNDSTQAGLFADDATYRQ